MTTTVFNQPEIPTSSLPSSAIRDLPAMADFAGRTAISIIFLLAGVNKIQYFDANAQYLASGGLPKFLLAFVILFEIVGALAIMVGYRVKMTALAFAGFSIATAILYHNNLADQTQFMMFFKNMAIAGGFLLLAAHGAGRISIDGRNRLSK